MVLNLTDYKVTMYHFRRQVVTLWLGHTISVVDIIGGKPDLEDFMLILSNQLEPYEGQELTEGEREWFDSQTCEELKDEVWEYFSNDPDVRDISHAYFKSQFHEEI